MVEDFTKMNTIEDMSGLHLNGSEPTDSSELSAEDLVYEQLAYHSMVDAIVASEDSPMHHFEKIVRNAGLALGRQSRTTAEFSARGALSGTARFFAEFAHFFDANRVTRAVNTAPYKQSHSQIWKFLHEGFLRYDAPDMAEQVLKELAIEYARFGNTREIGECLARIKGPGARETTRAAVRTELANRNGHFS